MIKTVSSLRKCRQHYILHFLTFIFACLTAELSSASSLQVSSVNIIFDGSQKVTSIEVKNHSNSAVLVQSELVSWVQANNRPVYTQTDDLIISPPIFELSANQSQTMRFALRDPRTPEVEKTYRVYLTELPVAQEPELETQPKVSKLKFSLRLGLPIFVGARDLKSKLKFSITKNCANDSWLFTATNSGAKHDRVLDFELRDASSGNVVIAAGATTRYVLANSTISWELNTGNINAASPLLAKIKYYPMKTEEVLIKPIETDCQSDTKNYNLGDTSS